MGNTKVNAENCSLVNPGIKITKAHGAYISNLDNYLGSTRVLFYKVMVYGAFVLVNFIFNTKYSINVPNLFQHPGSKCQVMLQKRTHYLVTKTIWKESIHLQCSFWYQQCQG
jgi:hypothetical protein